MNLSVDTLFVRVKANGGALAVDFLSEDELKAAREAERAGLLRWQSGTWGDTDYYLLPELELSLSLSGYVERILRTLRMVMSSARTARWERLITREALGSGPANHE